MPTRACRATVKVPSATPSAMTSSTTWTEASSNSCEMRRSSGRRSDSPQASIQSSQPGSAPFGQYAWK